MTLPATGPISLGAIRTELGASGPISLGSAAVRTLLGAASGTITMNAGHGKSNGLVTGTTGYSIGGRIGGLATNEFVGLVFASESVVDPIVGLIAARQLVAGVNSSTRGYAMGGRDDYGTSYNTIDGIRFDTEAAITTGAYLNIERYGITGANSSTVGYGMYGQGYNDFSGSAVWPMGVDGMVLATETNYGVGVFLSGGYYAASGFNSTARAYVMGSFSMDGPVNKTIALQFNTDTGYDLSATMATARYLTSGVNSTTRGYNLGGYTGSFATAEIDGLRFDTEASINPSAGLTSARFGVVGVNSNTRAYALGGNGSNEIDGLQFDTETAINPSAALPVAQSSGAGVQAGQG